MSLFPRKINTEKYLDDSNQVRLIINSDDRVSGSASQFRIMLNAEYRKIKTMRMISCIIPNTLYVFNNNPVKPNNTFTLKETAQPDATVTITPGTYNITQLLTELGTQLSAVSPTGSVYTATFNSVTQKLTISSTITTFQLYFSYSQSQSSPYIQLGYNVNVNYPSVAALSNISPNSINLTGSPYLIVKIGNVQDSVYTTFNISGNYYIPLNAEYGFVNYYQPSTNEETVSIIDDNNNTISYLDIGLVDENGLFVDLNGAEWSFAISFNFY